MDLYELSVSKLIDLPRETLFQAWTRGEYVAQWWCPRPWRTPVVELEFRAGGRLHTTMLGPDGEQVPCTGVFLEIVPNEKIVFTDAYVSAWVPSAKPFITATITFQEENGRTRYTASVSHWSAEDMERHRAMGFEEGWSIVIDQLAEVARGLGARGDH